MSFIHALKRLIDPNRWRIEQADRKRRLEVVFKESGAPGPKPPPGELPLEAKARCTRCGHRASDTSYCAKCLTFTMKALDEPG